MTAQFTAENIKQLQQDIANALKVLEKKHSVTFSLAFPRGYESYKFSFKGEITKPSPYWDSYLRHAAQLGLDPAWLEQRFSDKGRDYIIQGFNLEKNSVAASRWKNNGELGTTYGFTVEFIQNVRKFGRAT